MKIGILTLFHRNYNWGGVLQGYALKTYLENHFENVTVDILQYHSSKNIVYTNKIQQALQYSPSEIVKKIYKKLNKKNTIGISLDRRKQLFDSFMKEYTTNCRIYNDGNLSSAATEYDALICGSDQIWNPNVARPGYFLEMINEQCVKIAYAASIARDDLSKHEKKIMLPLIKRFEYISVREKTAKTFLNRYLNCERVKEVLDPALMLSREKWKKLSEGIEPFEEKYALAFFFSESLEYRKLINNYCLEQGLKLKYIPCARGEMIESDLQLPGDMMVDVGPKEFVSLFQNAQVIFTDSFHGMVFSIVFEKKFCVFERDKNSKVSKNSRLYDLLSKFELSDCLVKKNTNIDKLLEKNIDYIKVNKKLEQYRQESFMFLSNALSMIKERVIQSEPQVKPNPIELKSSFVECYIGYNDNEAVRMKSSSGGLFYELAISILNKNGAVYGAAFSNGFEVKHIRIENIKELESLLCSKYVQSNLGNTLKEVECDLREGKDVLFSGTPCQVSAVKTYIESKLIATDKLYLVDFICHGVPSPMVWKSYVKHNGKREKIINVNFRDKSHGWHDFYMNISYNRRNKKKSHELDSYMNTFLSDKNIRPSCYECIFKDMTYASQITLGDAWKIEKDKSDWADDKGTSLFVVRNSKGKELLKMVSENFKYESVDYSRWVGLNPSLTEPTKRPIGREEFFDNFIKLAPDEFWTIYKHIPLKKRIKYNIKRSLKKIGLEKTIRKMM